MDFRPLMSEPFRVRITVGGDKLPYPGDASSLATDLIEIQMIINSVISDADKGSRFLSADLKDCFLTTPMDTPEYMKVHYKYLPQDIRQRYNL